MSDREQKSSPLPNPSNTKGLTKREHFAGLAMQALCSIPNTGIAIDGLAKRSVQMADALIKELEK